MYTITITGELSGTDREKEFKESALQGQIKHFILELEGVNQATVDLDIAGEVNLRHQRDPGGGFAQQYHDRIAAHNVELD